MKKYEENVEQEQQLSKSRNSSPLRARERAAGCITGGSATAATALQTPPKQQAASECIHDASSEPADWALNWGAKQQPMDRHHPQAQAPVVKVEAQLLPCVQSTAEESEVTSIGPAPIEVACINIGPAPTEVGSTPVPSTSYSTIFKVLHLLLITFGLFDVVGVFDSNGQLWCLIRWLTPT